jgi:hypothetical protein
LFFTFDRVVAPRGVAARDQHWSMETMKHTVIGVAGVLAVLGGQAMAQSPEWMAEDCMVATQSFFQDFEAKTEMKYEGQRTDGTHAMNGTIYLETHSDDVQCSYDAAGTTMVDFFA